MNNSFARFGVFVGMIVLVIAVSIGIIKDYYTVPKLSSSEQAEQENMEMIHLDHQRIGDKLAKQAFDKLDQKYRDQ